MLRALWRWFVRGLRLAFILMLVVIPIPIATFVVKLLEPRRRAVPTLVMKKGD